MDKTWIIVSGVIAAIALSITVAASLRKKRKKELAAQAKKRERRVEAMAQLRRLLEERPTGIEEIDPETVRILYGASEVTQISRKGIVFRYSDGYELRIDDPSLGTTTERYDSIQYFIICAALKKWKRETASAT